MFSFEALNFVYVWMVLIQVLKTGNYVFALLLNLFKWSIKWQKVIITVVLKKHAREDWRVFLLKKQNTSLVVMWANASKATAQFFMEESGTPAAAEDALNQELQEVEEGKVCS